MYSKIAKKKTNITITVINYKFQIKYWFESWFEPYINSISKKKRV